MRKSRKEKDTKVTLIMKIGTHASGAYTLVRRPRRGGPSFMFRRRPTLEDTIVVEDSLGQQHIVKIDKLGPDGLLFATR